MQRSDSKQSTTDVHNGMRWLRNTSYLLLCVLVVYVGKYAIPRMTAINKIRKISENSPTKNFPNFPNLQSYSYRKQFRPIHQCSISGLRFDQGTVLLSLTHPVITMKISAIPIYRMKYVRDYARGR